MDTVPLKYKGLYKARAEPDVTKKGKKILQDNRKSNRNNLLMDKRKINANVVETSERKDANSTQALLDKLKAWKEMKKKEQSEKKAREKPIFKVHHISVDLGLPKLENVNKTIKGKVFNADPRKKPTNVSTYNFVPKNYDYKFAPNQATSTPHQHKSPDGGIASRLRSRTTSTLQPVKVQKNKKNTEKQSTVKGPLKRTSKRKENTNNLQTNKNPRKRKQSIENRPEYSSPQKKICSQSPSGSKTPSRTPLQQQLATSYVSPYVTISRGKSSARKEFQLRSSQGGLFNVSPQFARVTGPQAGAAHFHQVLDDEIARIEQMCADWLEYKDNENPPEEACDMINMAVGQSKLLLNRKFKQFRTLIVDCEECNSERSVTCSDLHGFWETTYLQVENVNKRFENLENLRKNDWKEILPEIEEPKKPQEKKVIKKPKKTKVQSSLKDLIKARRQKAKEQISDSDKLFLPTFVELPMLKSPTVSRKSSLASIVISETKKRNSSPGLVMIKAAKLGRRTGNTISSESTPGGILKTPRSKSVSKKSVLFKSGNSDDNIELLEDVGSPDLDTTFDLTSTSKPTRRSSRRLSRTTLMFDD